MFAALDEGEAKIVVDAIEEINGQAGDVIIQEGDQGDCLYVLEAGSLDCTKVLTGHTEPTFLKEYQPVEVFGELALLYNAPRAATIKAKTDYVIWKLDRDTFNHIVRDAAARKREKYEEFLGSVDLLQTLGSYERTQLCDALVERKFKAGDNIITEGEVGDTFYFISEGTAAATKQVTGGSEPVIVKEYEKGGYFGERALLTNEKRAANIIVTSSECACLSIEREAFTRLLGSL